jgi:hypothetical protein
MQQNKRMLRKAAAEVGAVTNHAAYQSNGVIKVFPRLQKRLSTGAGSGRSLPSGFCLTVVRSLL